MRNYDPNSGSFENLTRACAFAGAMLDELRRMDWVPHRHEKARKDTNTMAHWNKALAAAPTEAQDAKQWICPSPEYVKLLDESGPRRFVCPRWLFRPAEAEIPAAFTM